MTMDVRSDISAADRRVLLDTALELTDQLASVISAVVSSGFEVSAKHDESLVTTADVEAERAFRRAVASRYPHMGVIGEEFGPSKPEAEFQWVIDPIDGTAEFARHMPVYGIIIGLFYQGEPLLGVVDHPGIGLRCEAAFGLGARCNGKSLRIEDLPGTAFSGKERLGTPSRSAFVKFHDEGDVFDALVREHANFRVYHTCYTHTCAITDRLDAALEWDAPIWDIAAVRILVEEAGGRFVCLRDREQPGVGRVYSVVFGKPRMVESIARVLEYNM